MAVIKFLMADGKTQEIEATEGISLMESAVNNNVRGIDADCGGSCACGTCHVYVDPAWLARLPPTTDGEQQTLEFADAVRPNSRLSCQITVSAELDGLVVALPASRY